MPRYLLSALFVAATCLAPMQAADQAPATVEITLPPNAKVYVDDMLIRSRPGTHRLETPALEKGKVYSYTFKIEIERDGKTVTFMRKIPIQAGQTAKADFTELATAPVDKPDPEKPNPDKPKPDKPNPDKPKPEAEFKLSEMERDILDRTNAERKKMKLSELKPNPKLFEAARKHSENMARQDKLAHELDGKKPQDRVKDAGYTGGYVGENCAVGVRTAEQVVNGWMDSAGHRANILEPNYAEIGIGVSKAANGTLYYTQVFARPR